MQQAAGTGTGVSSVTATLNGVRGRSCIVLLGSFDTTNGVSSAVTDDLSVAATSIGSTTAGGFNQKLEAFYYPNYAGGSRTFTYNLTVAQSGISFLAIELFGVDRFNALLGFSLGSGNNTTPLTANISPTPTEDDTYLIGAGNMNAGGAATAPFTDIYSDSSGFLFGSEYRQPSIAVIAAGWTHPTGAWQTLLAGFRPDRNLRRRA